MESYSTQQKFRVITEELLPGRDLRTAKMALGLSSEEEYLVQRRAIEKFTRIWHLMGRRRFWGPHSTEDVDHSHVQVFRAEHGGIDVRITDPGNLKDSADLKRLIETLSEHYPDIKENIPRIVKAELVRIGMEKVLGRDLVGYQRWPDTEEAQTVADNFVDSIVTLIPEEEEYWKDEKVLEEYLTRKFGLLKVILAAGKSTRFGTLKQIDRPDGYNANIKLAREAASFGKREDVVVINWPVAYEILKDRKIDSRVKERIIQKIRDEFPEILEKAKVDQSEIFIADEIVGIIENKLVYSRSSDGENDSAAVMEKVRRLVNQSVQDPMKAGVANEEVGYLIFEELVEREGYIDNEKYDDVIGGNSLVVLVKPYGTGEALIAVIEKLEELGLADDTEYIMTIASDHGTALLDKYANVYFHTYLQAMNLVSPEVDRLPVITVAAKSPLDWVEGRANVILADSPYGSIPVAIKEWNAMSEGERREAREKLEESRRGEESKHFLPIGGLLIIDIHWAKERLPRLPNYPDPGKGKLYESFHTDLVGMAYEEYLSEGQKAPYTRIVGFGENAPAGIKTRTVSDTFRDEMNEMIRRKLTELGIDVDSEAVITISSRDARFDPDEDLARMFGSAIDGQRGRGNIHISGRVHLETSVRIENGAVLDGPGREVVLRGNTTVESEGKVIASEVVNSYVAGEVVDAELENEVIVADETVKDRTLRDKEKGLATYIENPVTYVAGSFRIKELSEEDQKGILKFVQREINNLYEQTISDSESREAIIKDTKVFFANSTLIRELTAEEIYRYAFAKIRKVLTQEENPFKVEKDVGKKALRQFACEKMDEVMAIDPAKDKEKARELFRELAILTIKANLFDWQSESARKVFTRQGFFQNLGANLDKDITPELAIDSLEDYERLVFDSGEALEFLYLTDNTPETEIDAAMWLLLSRLGHKVTVAGKGKAVRGDATVTDIRRIIDAHPALSELKRKGQLKVISTGSDTYGILLDKTPKEFEAAFMRARGVIAKGQANLYTLSARNGVKRPVIAQLLSKGMTAERVTGIPKQVIEGRTVYSPIIAFIPAGRHILDVPVLGESRGSLRELVTYEQFIAWAEAINLDRGSPSAWTRFYLERSLVHENPALQKAVKTLIALQAADDFARLLPIFPCCTPIGKLLAEFIGHNAAKFVDVSKSQLGANRLLDGIAREYGLSVAERIKLGKAYSWEYWANKSKVVDLLFDSLGENHDINYWDEIFKEMGAVDPTNQAKVAITFHREKQVPREYGKQGSKEYEVSLPKNLSGDRREMTFKYLATYINNEAVSWGVEDIGIDFVGTEDREGLFGDFKNYLNREIKAREFRVEDRQTVGSIVEALNKGKIPQALRDALFARERVDLPRDVTLEQINDNEWLINQKYIVKRENSGLNIYERTTLFNNIKSVANYGRPVRLYPRAAGVREEERDYKRYDKPISNLKDSLLERLGVQRPEEKDEKVVYIESDGNAASFGYAVGAVRRVEDAVVFILGTGLAGGVIKKGGQLASIVGQFGRAIINMSDKAPKHTATHIKGTLQSYLSGEKGIKRRAKKEGLTTEMLGLKADKKYPSAKEVGEAVIRCKKAKQSLERTADASAKEACEKAIKIFEMTADDIASAIAQFYKIFGKKKFVLLGGVVSRDPGEELLKLTQKSLKRRFPDLKQVKVRLGKVREVDHQYVGAYGVAHLANKRAQAKLGEGEYNPETGRAIGIDVGATKTKVGFLDLDKGNFKFCSKPSSGLKEATEEGFFKAIAGLIEEAESSFGKVGVYGVSLAGLVDHRIIPDGYIAKASSFHKNWDRVKVKSHLPSRQPTTPSEEKATPTSENRRDSYYLSPSKEDVLIEWELDKSKPPRRQNLIKEAILKDKTVLKDSFANIYGLKVRHTDSRIKIEDSEIKKAKIRWIGGALWDPSQGYYKDVYEVTFLTEDGQKEAMAVKVFNEGEYTKYLGGEDTIHEEVEVLKELNRLSKTLVPKFGAYKEWYVKDLANS